MKNKIAILLAAYNGYLYIEDQIESILNQENIEVMIFISFDISNDHTRTFVEKKYGTHPKIVLLEDVGKFGGAAKNFFRLIRDVDFQAFDYIAFADQDDIWYPDKLSRAIEALTQQNADGYSSNVLAFWEDGREQLIVKSQPQCRYDYLFEAAGPGCTYVMSKKLGCTIQNCVKSEWDNIQNIWLHDWFCYAYARAHGYTWIIDEKPSMGYRQHIHNQVGVNQGFKAFIHRIRKVVNGSAMKQAALIAKLVGLEEDVFVKKWSALNRSGFLYLAFYANTCRRRLKDKCLFFFASIMMSIRGAK